MVSKDIENDNLSRRGYISGGGLVPVPDPTALTTAQLRQEITALRELMESKITAVADQSVARTEKLEQTVEEIFKRIEVQFTERDKSTGQLALANSTAIAAALQAAEKAVSAQNASNTIAIAKSESSTVESIRQLQTLFKTAIDAMNDKINDVKSRLDKGEGHSKGIGDSWGVIVGAAIIGGLIVGVIELLMKISH